MFKYIPVSRWNEHWTDINLFLMRYLFIPELYSLISAQYSILRDKNQCPTSRFVRIYTAEARINPSVRLYYLLLMENGPDTMWSAIKCQKTFGIWQKFPPPCYIPCLSDLGQAKFTMRDAIVLSMAWLALGWGGQRRAKITPSGIKPVSSLADLRQVPAICLMV